MKLKRFVAPDTTKAMRKIKEAFGDDAVILSSHTVADGVEVVAAIDYDDSVVNSKLSLDAPQAIQLPELSSSNSSSFAKPTNLDEIKQELSHLREMVENQLSGFAWQNISHYQPMQMMLMKRLTKLGFDINLSEKLVQSVTETEDSHKAWLMLLSKVLERVHYISPELLQMNGCYAFVGPTGVGKTTTIAKLAARFCLQHGAEHLGLVTMDGYRIAAVEQLVTFAKILGVNVSIAQNQETLQTTLNKLSNKKLVLIDTAGMNPSDPRVNAQFEMMARADVPVNPILVFSATSQYGVLEKIHQKYAAHDLYGSIMTKVDEADSIGASLSMLINHKLPLGYLTHGQRVPEDLKAANKQVVIESLIGKQDQIQSSINIRELASSLSGSDTYATK